MSQTDDNERRDHSNSGDERTRGGGSGGGGSDDGERDQGLLDVVQRWLGILTLAALSARLIFGVGRWRLTILLAVLFLGWTFLSRTLRGFVQGLMGED